MNDKINCLKTKYRINPGWYWLLAIIFLFPILPEYVSPFILFAGFIVFKRQWTREGKKAKVGTLGKLIILFMTLALVSVLWSDTKFSSFAPSFVSATPNKAHFPFACSSFTNIIFKSFLPSERKNCFKSFILLCKFNIS